MKEQSTIGMEDIQKPHELSLAEIDQLLVFGGFSVSIRDATAFIQAVTGFSNSYINCRVFVADSFFDIITEQVDRFSDVLIIQKCFVDLVYTIVNAHGDMNILSMKVLGLFGRLRMAKQSFTELSSRIEDLLNGLFRVSVKAIKVDFGDGVEGPVDIEDDKKQEKVIIKEEK